MARHVEAMVGFLDAGAEVFDYGNSIRGEAQLGGYDAGLRLPRLRARLHPAAVLRGQGPVPLGRAVRRPGGHRRDRPRGPRPVPGERVAARAGSALAAGEGRTSRACPRGSAGSATASATWPGCAFNELVATGEVARADRHRPRPPRLRLGRLALPRDRGDARRLRRDRRLAAAQRAGQRRLAAPPGCRSTTAAASASAARSTPARSPSPTAPPLAAAEARARADQRPRHGRRSATSTRATSARRGGRARSAASASRCAEALDAPTGPSTPWLGAGAT